MKCLNRSSVIKHESSRNFLAIGESPITVLKWVRCTHQRWRQFMLNVWVDRYAVINIHAVTVNTESWICTCMYIAHHTPTSSKHTTQLYCVWKMRQLWLAITSAYSASTDFDNFWETICSNSSLQTANTISHLTFLACRTLRYKATSAGAFPETLQRLYQEASQSQWMSALQVGPVYEIWSVSAIYGRGPMPPFGDTPSVLAIYVQTWSFNGSNFQRQEV